MWFRPEGLALLVTLLLSLSACMTTDSRTLVGSQKDISSVRNTKYFAELETYPSYEASILRVKLTKTETVRQSERKSYRTKGRLWLASVFVPATLGLGGGAVWSMTTPDSQRTRAFAAGAVACAVASLIAWDKTAPVNGEETISTESDGFSRDTSLERFSVTVKAGTRSVTLTSSRTGQLDIDVVKDLKISPAQPEDVVISILFDSEKPPATFSINSKLWTKPFFQVSSSTSGSVYAEKRTSSEKIESFKGGERWELIGEPSGSWTSVLVGDTKKSRMGWVPTSAGSVVWLPKTR